MMTEQTNSQVKRFVAPTMTRALELVQRELGPDAIILRSRQVKGGVEIITSIEEEILKPEIKADRERQEFSQKFDAELDRAMPSDMAWNTQSAIEKAVSDFSHATTKPALADASPKPLQGLEKEIEAAREKMFAAKRRAQQEAESASRRPVTDHHYKPSVADVVDDKKISVDENSELNALKNELADMRMLLEQQLWQMGQGSSALEHMAIPGQVNMPQQFVVLSEHLAKLGLSPRLVDEFVAQTQHHEKPSLAWRECLGLLAKRIPIADTPILSNPGVYAFLGQTGVGKTTTIAKLAAQYVMKHGAGKVALVTTDTYRVGAFDQLRTMGRILGVPVKVVDKENSLLTMLSTLRQFPMVLVDTAGFRLGDPKLKAQLEQLESCAVLRRVLVLSCNSQLATMKASVHAHRGKRGLVSCILTKLDESASIGEAISLAVDEKLPISYLADGQDIPKDIAQASGQALVAKAVALSKATVNSAQTYASL